MGVYYYRRARTHVTHWSPTLGPAHTHALTIAHIVALTPRLTEQACRARNEDVLEALDCLSSPM